MCESLRQKLVHTNAVAYTGVNILSFNWISHPGTITSFLDVKGRIRPKRQR